MHLRTLNYHILYFSKSLNTHTSIAFYQFNLILWSRYQLIYEPILVFKWSNFGLFQASKLTIFSRKFKSKLFLESCDNTFNIGYGGGCTTPPPLLCYGSGKSQRFYLFIWYIRVNCINNRLSSESAIFQRCLRLF